MKNIGKTLGLVLSGAALLFFASSFTFSSQNTFESKAFKKTQATTEIIKEEIAHLTTPEPLKGVYMTQCAAATPKMRENLTKLIEETELNSVIIDIKDYTGTVSFKSGIPEIDSLSNGGKGCKVKDMKELISELHDKNIYVIGRLTVFQDPLYSKYYPELAVKRLDGAVWKDRKGLSFIDVGAKPFWDYIIKISESAYDIGFDEINFDYIRFPSDGNMKDISFIHTGTASKREMLRQFFEYLDQNLKGKGIVTSADIFGMTTTNTDDMNIGQVLENALLYFDYVCPMVYPSHYPPNFNGWPDPNKIPYEIVKFSMDSAVARAKYLQAEMITKMYTVSASSTVPQKTEAYNGRIEKRIGIKQLRPWLQDNDYPIHYTPQMVRAQIQATYDAGLTSWMLWDPSNQYTKEALLIE